jgi:hypothetical protein
MSQVRPQSLLIAALSALVLLPFAASPARASTDVMTCDFTGVVRVTPPMDLLTPNEGSYAFSSTTGTCSNVDNNSTNPSPEAGGPFAITLVSNGEYESSVCGTATFDSEAWEGPPDEDGGPDEHGQEDSTPAVITSGAFDPEFPVRFNYHAGFVNNLANVTVANWAVDDTGMNGVPSQHADGIGATGMGTFKLTPLPLMFPPAIPGDSLGDGGLVDGDCGGGFMMTGHLVINLSDTGNV